MVGLQKVLAEEFKSLEGSSSSIDFSAMFLISKRIKETFIVRDVTGFQLQPHRRLMQVK